MIKVHCFVSCVCELLKKRGVDHRPYYFGVWDADFFVNEKGALAYHADDVDHTFFKEWYETLYGITLKEWYEPLKSKSANIQKLVQLVEEKNKDTHVMVMLDLALLPERENKFHHSPFPHYVMLEKTENPTEWFMFDPDFRWEGRMQKEEIINAIQSPHVSGGYVFNGDQIRPPTDETVDAYFRTCMKAETNPLTEAVQRIVDSFWFDEDYLLSELGDALKQLPVLAIRKYAYEHAFAFFWFKLQFSETEFDNWCDEIEALEKGYKIVQYRAIKLAKTKRQADHDQLCAQLKSQFEREMNIKQKLIHYFEKWNEERENVINKNKGGSDERLDLYHFISK
ncbi:DUF6005 family protein [Alkalihalobacillus sp. LMS6]|nr:DUF6005 family protein [Alkalihalobacillus sp. LMS6]UTR08061.1 DUF6005 family protein [Alkalihalobacillus sp. LMS6]